MKIGDTLTMVEIINEIAKSKNKRDFKLHYEYGFSYRFYTDTFKLIRDNGTGLYVGKVLNDKFTIEGYYYKKEEY